MRTRNATLIAAPALALALTACTGADYQINGKVAAKHAEWDCADAEALTLNGDTIAPVAQQGTAGTGGTRPKPKPPAPKVDNGSTTTTGGGGNSVKIKKPKKVKVSAIPDGQEALPVNPPKGKKSCKPDYELYVRNNTGTFEQDVISEHYDRCTEGEKFPACTKEN